MNDPRDIESVLALTSWAVVGLSSDPRRASNGVAAFLQARGKDVHPVNPGEREVHGVPAVAALADLAEVPEVVDVFRRSSRAGAVVDEAIKVGAKAVWLQLGVVDEAAAARAREAGLLVVMDTCPKMEWVRYGPR